MRSWTLHLPFAGDEIGRDVYLHGIAGLLDHVHASFNNRSFLFFAKYSASYRTKYWLMFIGTQLIAIFTEYFNAFNMVINVFNQNPVKPGNAGGTISCRRSLDHPIFTLTCQGHLEHSYGRSLRLPMSKV